MDIDILKVGGKWLMVPNECNKDFYCSRRSLSKN